MRRELARSRELSRGKVRCGVLIFGDRRDWRVGVSWDFDRYRDAWSFGISLCVLPCLTIRCWCEYGDYLPF